MIQKYWRYASSFFILLFAAAFLMNCSGSRYINVRDVKQNQSLKLYLRDGDAYEGIIVERNQDEIILVSATDSQLHTVQVNNIRRVERSRNTYDYTASPISDAEIEKHRTQKNKWVYAAGGAVLGGVAGIALGYPVWVANDTPPPLFVGGLTAVVSSIVFASHGTKKDKYQALQKVRYLRGQDGLVDAKTTEEKRIKELQAEKERLEKELQKKREKQKD